MTNRRWKQWQILFSWAPKSLKTVILKDACSLEEKLWQTWTVLKSRDITLLTKICIVKTMVFPVVMSRCESWTVKKSECKRIDTIELWCWRGILRVSPLDCKIKPVNPKGNQPWIFIGSIEAEIQILWCEEPTHWKRPWCWQIEGKTRRRWQRMTWLDSVTD